MQKIKELFGKFQNIKIGVIGDVMLDSYYWGAVDRISPEAPVPIVSIESKEQRIGGAGNVALNLKSLGAVPFLISVFGKDDDGDKLSQLLDEREIDQSYSIRSADRITTNKIRVISRNQHMLRLDAEVTDDINTKTEDQLLKSVLHFIEEQEPDVIILEDYNKGVLTHSLIKKIISAAKDAQIITAVDPKRKNFLSYHDVTIFKPNLSEVKEALNILHVDVNERSLKGIHNQLFDKLHHYISFITLSDKGVYLNNSDQHALIPSHFRNISDVSGAGDTVMAVAALVYAASGDPLLMADIANIAGGLVCEEVGTVAIDRSKLLHECELLLQPTTTEKNI